VKLSLLIICYREELQLSILAPVRYQQEFSSLGLAASSGVLLIGTSRFPGLLSVSTPLSLSLPHLFFFFPLVLA
jgi:hypothetical protein